MKKLNDHLKQFAKKDQLYIKKFISKFFVGGVGLGFLLGATIFIDLNSSPTVEGLLISEHDKKWTDETTHYLSYKGMSEPKQQIISNAFGDAGGICEKDASLKEVEYEFLCKYKFKNT